MPTVVCRGLRGATTVEENDRAQILEATRELLKALVNANGIEIADVASALFSSTPDLTAAFPATAAREMGWEEVALFGSQEVPVPGALPKCVRVLIHWNTSRAPQELRHIYLRGAVALRPDRAGT